MPILTDQMLEKLELLSRIKFDSQERKIFIHKFDHIVQLIDKIQDITNLKSNALSRVIEKKQEFRDDEIAVRNSVEDVFLNSSNTNMDYYDKRYFVVPKILK